MCIGAEEASEAERQVKNFKQLLDDFVQETHCSSQIQQQSLDHQSKGLNIYKILHNKRKIDISSATFGCDDEFAIINVCDVTSIKKYEKEKLSSRFQTIYF